MKRRFLAFLAAVLMTTVGVMAVNPVAVMAADDNEVETKNCGTGNFLGFRPWYAGLCNDQKEIAQPAKGDEQALALFIWTIVLNVTFDVTLAVGYIAIGFVIYGGFLYIMSQGDPTKLMRGKKTLTAAVIGTIIAMSATVIVNTIKVVLSISSNDVTQQNFTQDTIQGAFNWAYTAAGLVAVIFIIKGGLDLVIGHGDPARIQKAKMGIIYAVAGLIIVILAAVATTFVISATGKAM